MGRSILLFTLSSVLWAQTPQEPAHIRFFQAVPGTAQIGGTVTIRWSASGVERVRLEPLGVELPAEGEMQWAVQGRTVFWLNAVNVKGGQSTPLVVEPLPEPVRVRPDQPGFLLGAAQPSEVGPPPVAAPQPGAALPPATAPARREPARVWIQFATMTDPHYAARLHRKLARLPGVTLCLAERVRQGSARKRLCLRAGPYRSVRAARYRMQRLEPMLLAMNLKPLVILDRSSVQPVYLAAR
jgi:hypothetical protein